MLVATITVPPDSTNASRSNHSHHHHNHHLHSVNSSTPKTSTMPPTTTEFFESEECANATREKAQDLAQFLMQNYSRYVWDF